MFLDRGPGHPDVSTDVDPSLQQTMEQMSNAIEGHPKGDPTFKAWNMYASSKSPTFKSFFKASGPMFHQSSLYSGTRAVGSPGCSGRRSSSFNRSVTTNLRVGMGMKDRMIVWTSGWKSSVTPKIVASPTICVTKFYRCIRNWPREEKSRLTVSRSIISSRKPLSHLLGSSM